MDEQKRKIRTLAGIAVVLIGVILLVMPASAEQFGVKSQLGGVSQSFSMSLASTADVSMPLSVGTMTATGSTVHIATNVPYKVYVKDAMNAAKLPAHAGYMALYGDPSGPYASIAADKLTSQLKIKLNGGSFIPFSATDTEIRSGTAEDITSPLSFEQQVLVTDKVLAPDKYYRCDIVITGAATP